MAAKKFVIDGNDYETLLEFQKKHKLCVSKFPNMTGAQYQYTFMEDGLGTFKQVKCCCGEHIDLTAEYDASIIPDNHQFQVLTEDQGTQKTLRILMNMKKRPRMFMGRKSYQMINSFLYGLAIGICGMRTSEEYELACWSEIEPFINESMLPKVNSEEYSDEQLFDIFFETLEEVICERFPQFSNIIVK